MIPKRLENAINKLAKAFLNDELNAYDCKACAVGNLCNNELGWQYLIRLGKVKDKDSEIPYETKDHITARKIIKDSNYSIEELAKIEHTFLKAVVEHFDFSYIKEGYLTEGSEALVMSTFTYNTKKQEANYKGLIAVVDLLFSFENLDNQEIKQEQLNKFEYEQKHN